MRIKDVRDLLNAEVLCGEDRLDMEVASACGADLMSDVLAFVKDQGVLLTGLLNPQAVRTAEMMDMCCIVIVRGKRPDQQLIDLARERGIVMLATAESLYASCGKLYQNGLTGVE
jgi:predicted transcriptional regulator